MNEKTSEHFEEEPKQEQAQETELQPEVEMPEDFVEPEGKKSKWKTVKGEVEVEGKKVEVSYREKVIELPKHRQEETGIKRIRRRELLPPFPKGMYEKKDEYRFINVGEELDETYKYLTDGRFPSYGVWVHNFQFLFWKDIEHGEKFPLKNIERFQKEGLYFQEIFPRTTENISTAGSVEVEFFEKIKGGIEKIPEHEGNTIREIPKEQLALYYLHCSPKRMWINQSVTPIFVFGSKNQSFMKYLNSIVNHPETRKMIHKGNLEGFKKTIETGILPNDVALLPCVQHPDIKSLRWCHAECALVPTKRSLNVLFFETGDEDKKEAKKEK